MHRVQDDACRSARYALRHLVLFTCVTMVAVACGGGDDSSHHEDTGPAGGGNVPADKPIDPDGVLRVALNMTIGPGYEIDPLKGGSIAYESLTFHTLGELLYLDPEGVVQPFLAESFMVTSPTTMELELREGLTFHDGTPYDAQAVREGILEHRAGGSPTFNQPALAQVADIRVDSATKLTFTMSAPVAGGLPHVLSTSTGAVGYLGPDGLPVGAGPYRVVEYHDRQSMRIEKWDGFFDASKYALEAIEFRNIPAPEAAQNALRAGQVDIIAANAGDVDALLKTGPFAEVATDSNAFYVLSLCNTQPPFDDPKFREAFDLAIDRDQLSTAVLGGRGKPMEGVWAPGRRFAPADVVDTTGDPERAQQLLEEINWDTATQVRMGVYNLPIHQRLLEVIQGQLDKVGIKIEIVPAGATVLDVINERTPGGYIAVNTFPGVQGVNRMVVEPGHSLNACNYTNADVAALTAKVLAGGLSEPDLADTWKQIQATIVGDHLVVPLVTQQSIYVYDTTRVQGLEPGVVGLAAATAVGPFWEGVSIIKQ